MSNGSVISNNRLSFTLVMITLNECQERDNEWGWSGQGKRQANCVEGDREIETGI